MKNLLVFIPLLYALVPLATAQDMPVEEWQKIHENEGVTTYFRTDGAGLCWFKATAMIEAPVANVAPYLADINSFRTWMPNFSCGEALADEQGGDQHLYLQLDMPALALRHDVSAQYTFSLEGQDASGKLTNQPRTVPAQASFARVQDFNASFSIQSVSAETCTVTFQTCIAFKNPAPAAPFHEKIDEKMQVFAVESIFNLQALAAGQFVSR